MGFSPPDKLSWLSPLALGLKLNIIRRQIRQTAQPNCLGQSYGYPRSKKKTADLLTLKHHPLIGEVPPDFWSKNPQIFGVTSPPATAPGSPDLLRAPESYGDHGNLGRQSHRNLGEPTVQ